MSGLPSLPGMTRFTTKGLDKSQRVESERERIVAEHVHDRLALIETVGLSDVVGSLGTTGRGLIRGGVGETGDVGGTLLDDAEGDDGKIGTNNAATDRLAALVTLQD